MIADLKVTFSDKRTATAVEEALSPDNVNLPIGMRIDQKIEGRKIIIKVSTADDLKTPIERLISTLDEFLSHIHTATQTIEKTKLRSRIDRSKNNKRRSRKNQRQSSKAKRGRLSN
jgi:hypothetical protein